MGLISGLSFELVLILSALIIGAGFAVRYGLKMYQNSQRKQHYWYRSDREFTVKELVVSSLVAILVVLPLTNVIVHTIAQSNSVGGFKEFWNGSVISAKSQEIVCTRDGSCVHDYDCDPYLVPVTKTRTVPDGKGGTTTETYIEMETRYHSCPYADREYNYWLNDSLDQKIDIASHIFAASPQEWRRGSGIPDGVARGIPQEWTDVQNSIIHGDNPPSTLINKYTNYLLASSDSLLKAYSDKIEVYRERGLLADHTRNMKDNPLQYGYRADKAVFVKMEPDANQYREWQRAVGRLNSQLGTELQGDLHMLAVPAKEIDNPDDYTNALLAYWQSRDYGKEALGKNAIMIVVGVSADGKKVEWARAKTGIPEGNGEMLAAISIKLTGVKFAPETLIGGPTASWSGEGEGSLSFTSTKGAVEQIVLRDHPFLRPCMMCKDDGDNGLGYVYLKDSAMLPGWVPWVIGIVVFFISLGIFWFMVANDLNRLTGSLVDATGDLAARAGRKVRGALSNIGRK